MEKNSIIPASLAITSMRDSGYKTAAHALAELIDNSIQATADTVQLICIDKTNDTGQRRIKYVDQIAVFDNGKGMRPNILQQALQFGGGSHRDDPNGIGKFGMGLPSATISQCRRLDIYSWVEGVCYYTYLDVEQIEIGEMHSVPEPIQQNLPSMWVDAIGDDLNSEHGTLTIWSDLDRITWKTSKSIYIHSEKLIGRMYRHFIANKKVLVRFKSFTNDISLIKDKTELFKPNDPLFLYKDTVLPELPTDYKNESFFEPFGDPQEIIVELADGTKGKVNIKYSRVVRSIHQAISRTSSKPVGSTEWGKIAAENTGISIVRSGREIKLDTQFNNNDPRERFWGIEVSFSPALDELFGVTFDKQDVVNFEPIELSIEAENEGFDADDKNQFREFEDLFEKGKSERYWIHYIGKQIKNNLTSLREHTKSLKEQIEIITPLEEKNKLSHAEEIAKKISARRVDEKKASDSERKFYDSTIPNEIKEAQVANALTKDGFDFEEAKEIARTLISNNCNVKFIEQPIRGNMFFDIARESGTIIVQLNTNHEFYKFYSEFDEGKREVMKLILIAWAQCEDSCDQTRREDMYDIRTDWGRMMKNYLFELNN